MLVLASNTIIILQNISNAHTVHLKLIQCYNLIELEKNTYQYVGYASYRHLKYFNSGHWSRVFWGTELGGDITGCIT